MSVAAIALDVSEQRVRQLVAEGKLPGSRRLGSTVWFVSPAAVFARRREMAAEAREAETNARAE